jgi:hypothetical protein
MIQHPDALLARLRHIHTAIRDSVLAACQQSPIDQLSQAVGEAAGDTLFAVDRVSEQTLLEHFDALAREWPLLLVAEGLGSSGQRALPAGCEPEIVVIVDPIDGSRGLMYQKRPAWILTGVASYSGRHPSLADVSLALQTEIPLVKQHLSDSLWAVMASQRLAVGGERFNRLTGERAPLSPRPSQAASIEHGFGSLARFFPGTRALMAAIDDALVEHLLGPAPRGRSLAFEDQYISTGGQLYELLMGHDRWVGDLRALAPGFDGLTCHPYDLCTELIGRAAGLHISDVHGRRLRAPLDVETGVAWLGFANQTIRDQVLPVLQRLLRQHGLV